MRCTPRHCASQRGRKLRRPRSMNAHAGQSRPGTVRSTAWLNQLGTTDHRPAIRRHARHVPGQAVHVEVEVRKSPWLCGPAACYRQRQRAGGRRTGDAGISATLAPVGQRSTRSPHRAFAGVKRRDRRSTQVLVTPAPSTRGRLRRLIHLGKWAAVALLEGDMVAGSPPPAVSRQPFWTQLRNAFSAGGGEVPTRSGNTRTAASKYRSVGDVVEVGLTDW
jgi:hypothetical protein